MNGILDRHYFQSIYVQDPDGTIVEVKGDQIFESIVAKLGRRTTAFPLAIMKSCYSAAWVAPWPARRFPVSSAKPQPTALALT